MAKNIDLIGKVFGRLIVIAEASLSKRGERQWVCKCDCGNPTNIIVASSVLRGGHKSSCGCKRASKGEVKIMQLLLQSKIPFIKEFKPFKFKNGHYASFDFYVANKYLIEYDGETHYSASIGGWHRDNQICNQKQRDLIKNTWCETNHIPLIRIPYFDLQNITIQDLIPQECNNFWINKHSCIDVNISLDQLQDNSLSSDWLPEFYSKAKSVLQFSMSGQFLKQYVSCEDAARSINGQAYCIWAAAKNPIRHKTYLSYQWRFVNSEYIVNDLSFKPIDQFSKKGDYLQTYYSKEALIQNGFIKELENIYKVCRGIPNRRTAGGYIWKFH